jgi:hypothetical protein
MEPGYSWSDALYESKPKHYTVMLHMAVLLWANNLKARKNLTPHSPISWVSLEKRRGYTTPSWPLANVKWVELMRGRSAKNFLSPFQRSQCNRNYRRMKHTLSVNRFFQEPGQFSQQSKRIRGSILGRGVRPFLINTVLRQWGWFWPLILSVSEAYFKFLLCLNF